MGKSKPKEINKRNFELALIIGAIIVGVVGAFAYENHPIAFHQIPLLNLIP